MPSTHPMLKASREAGLEELDRIRIDIDKLMGQLAQFQDLLVNLKETYEELILTEEWMDIK